MDMQLKTFRLKIDTKSISDDGEYATFKGYASTFGNEDSYGDVIEKGAFTKTAAEANGTLPMLWQHDTDEVIGTYPAMAENDNGLVVEGSIVLATQRGREAYALLKAGAIKSMSIGFTIPEGKASFDQERQVRRIHEVRLWEISLVTFPANTRAAITEVRKRELAAETDAVQALEQKVAALEAQLLEQKWDGSASLYSDEQWAKACILDRRSGTPKERYGLPIATPGHSWSSDPDPGGVAAAASRIGETHGPAGAIHQAYQRLAEAYRKLGHKVPPAVAEHAKADPAELEVRDFLTSMGHTRAADALADGDADAADETALRLLIADLRSTVNRDMQEA